MSSTRVKIGTVWKVDWFRVWARKARSARVISETSEVAFRSSMNRLPHGGIIELLKATSLISLITLADLAFRAQTLNQSTFKTVPIFTLVLLIYLALSLMLTIGMRFLEDRAGAGLARGRAR